MLLVQEAKSEAESEYNYFIYASIQQRIYELAEQSNAETSDSEKCKSGNKTSLSRRLLY